LKPMNKSWKRFLFVQFPVAVLVIALAAQACAWVLSGVPMRRDRTDELALAVLSDPTNYKVILLGDSITRNATARFGLGAPGEVANLSTHAHFGLSGELLLVRRYLSAHSPPKHVVVALAPAMYGWVTDIRHVRYHLWHTFQRDDERSFLKAYLPDIDNRDWLPAVADLQERVVEPFFSFLKAEYLAYRGREAARIAAGTLEPDPSAATEASTPVAPEVMDVAISERLNTVPAPINSAALSELCRLSEQHGFAINFVWPPMAPEIERAMAARGTLEQLEQHIRGIMKDNCRVDDGIFDFSSLRTYTALSFHRDIIHLFGEGWEQRYASDLRRYLSALLLGVPVSDLHLE
jgi:hypothetical protein